MNPIAFQALLKSLNDDNPNVRAKAVEALSKSNNPEVIEEIRLLLDDENALVRETAESTLKKLIPHEFPTKNTVPVWNEYFPVLTKANPEQQTFYNNWISEAEKGEYIDINGNLSYIFVYLYSLIGKFLEDKDITYFVKRFNRIGKAYNQYKTIANYLLLWKSDAYLYVGKYDKALELSKEKGLLSFEAAVFAQILSEKNIIDGNDLIYMVGTNSLTDFGKNNQKLVSEVATLFLNDFFKEHSKNIVEYFLTNYDFRNLSEKDFNSLKEFFPKENDFLKLKNRYNNSEKILVDDEFGDKYYLFRGTMFFVPAEFGEKYSKVPKIIYEALKQEVRRIIRESENTVREEMNIPKVGEGWVSESELFYKIKDQYPVETVIHHGRPGWIGRQHLDVYFPEKNIAIEYQGIQHDKAVEYFGGEKNFKKQQKLDERKLRRCEENGCNLLYVYPDYDFDEVKKQIDDLLNQ